MHILLLKYAEAAIAGSSYYPSPNNDPHLEWKGLHQQYYNALANYGCSIYKFHHPELLTLSTVLPSLNLNLDPSAITNCHPPF